MVLASCVIEVCINIRADAVATWLTVLRGELRPAARDQAYGAGTPQVRSCWAATRKFPLSTGERVWHQDSRPSVAKRGEKKKNSVCV